MVRALRRVYQPTLEFVLANRIITFAGIGLDRARRGVRGALARPRVPAQTRGGQSLGPRDVSAVGVARGQRHVREPHARADEPLSRSADGGLAARPAGRRHRRDRLLQCRILRAAQALRNLALGRRQGKAHAGHDARAAAAVSRRGLQFLAIHPGQRRGGGVRGEGREFRQGVRQRPGDAGENRGRGRGRARQGAGHRGSRRAALARAADHPHRRGPRPRGALWARAGRRQCRGADRDRRPERRRSVRRHAAIGIFR